MHKTTSNIELFLALVTALSGLDGVSRHWSYFALGKSKF
jgi:hypothetical protein